MEKTPIENHASQYGLVNFEERGMPWTAVRGKYELLQLEILDEFGHEPHWRIKLESGGETHIPESCVVVIPFAGRIG